MNFTVKLFKKNFSQQVFSGKRPNSKYLQALQATGSLENQEMNGRGYVPVKFYL